MGSTSSIVISFSIAILLLLVLLLLLSYNSKCKADKVERFTDDKKEGGGITDLFNFGNVGGLTADILNDNINMDFTKGQERFSGLTANDNFALNTDGRDLTTGQINKNSIMAYNTDINGSLLTENEGFENPLVPAQDPTTCFKRDRLTKDDLLPKDANSKWASLNPSSSGDITDKNFLTAGYHIGVNTVGQSLRNANLQLRSEIPNPQVAVSPWMISTIEPDIRPVSFEIGSAPSF